MKEISTVHCHATAKDTFQTQLFKKGRGINATHFLNQALPHQFPPPANKSHKK
jgi:hypothetical protein